MQNWKFLSSTSDREKLFSNNLTGIAQTFKAAFVRRLLPASVYYSQNCDGKNC